MIHACCEDPSPSLSHFVLLVIINRKGHTLCPNTQGNVPNEYLLQ
jgi:hypothetical protein